MSEYSFRSSAFLLWKGETRSVFNIVDATIGGENHVFPSYGAPHPYSHFSGAASKNLLPIYKLAYSHSFSMGAGRRRCSSEVEQLFRKQRVGGSIPLTGFSLGEESPPQDGADPPMGQTMWRGRSADRELVSMKHP